MTAPIIHLRTRAEGFKAQPENMSAGSLPTVIEGGNSIFCSAFLAAVGINFIQPVNVTASPRALSFLFKHKEPAVNAIAFRSRTSARAITHPLAAALIVAIVVYLASLFGILTRPVGFLAALWPANAILLGLMVRKPDLATFWGWLGAFAGYLAADLSTGGDLKLTLWLTVANMSGAITGYLLFGLIPATDRGMQRPLSVLKILGICIVAASVASLVGGGAARLAFGRDFLSGLEFWFVTEFVNALIILPVMLTLPLSASGWRTWCLSIATCSRAKVAPLLVLFCTVAAGVWIGGPGAVAFVVPALLFCALTYSIFNVALLTMLTCSWLLVAISAGIIQIDVQGDPLATTSSLRLGIALIALAPLTAASIDTARRELLEQLAYAASRDGLTGALNRKTFLDMASKLLGDPSRTARSIAILMVDIDHFKQINDNHGHAMGDAVLKAFARFVSDILRPGDLFGRMGGEEFAIALPGTDMDKAAEISERIRKATEDAAEEFSGLSVTVSIGVTTSESHPSENIEALLATADQALYRAKAAGRNRVRRG
ncbi:diguanylate cyclase [Shinella sp. BYT-45]|uniref:GGDEF domain-containing protein n=1 Tax=Shinella sp. BYT-45 TaxID=3377377 RepID=UPI00397F7FEA